MLKMSFERPKKHHMSCWCLKLREYKENVKKSTKLYQAFLVGLYVMNRSSSSSNFCILIPEHLQEIESRMELLWILFFFAQQIAMVMCSLKTEEEKAAILNSLSRPFAICVENFFFLGLFHKTPISNLEKYGRKVRSLEEIYSAT